MAFNGSGTFNLPAGNPVVVGTIADPVVHNNTNTEIAVALSNCVTRDGQSPLTADLPMAGHKLTGLSVATAAGEAVEYSQIPQTVGLKNKLLNGDFDIWQIGTSQNLTGYGTADRWRPNIVGTSNTVTQQAFVLGQTDVPYNPTYYHRSTVVLDAAAGSFTAIEQRIEDVRTLSGSTATLSFWAKADAPKSLSIEFEQNFGTGGTPSAFVDQIGVTKFSLSTTWTKFTATVAIPSIAGKTLGTQLDDRLTLWVWLDAGSNYDANTGSLGHQTGTFDIAQFQLEPGSAATTFEQVPYQTKLSLCQRHLESVLPFWDASFWVTATAGAHYLFHIPFHVRKRFPPTVVADTAFATYVAVNTPTLLNPTRHGVNLRFQTFTGVAQNATITFSSGDRFIIDAQL